MTTFKDLAITCRDRSRQAATALRLLADLHAEIDHAHQSIRNGYAGPLAAAEEQVGKALSDLLAHAWTLAASQDTPPANIAAAPDTLCTLVEAHEDGLLTGLLLEHWAVQIRRLAAEYGDYAESCQGDMALAA